MAAIFVIIGLVGAGIASMYFDVGGSVLLVLAGLPVLGYVTTRPAMLGGVCLALDAWPTVTLGGDLTLTPFKFSVMYLAVIVVLKIARDGVVTMPRSLMAGLAYLVFVGLIAELLSPAGSHFINLYTLLGSVLIAVFFSQVIRTMDDFRDFLVPMVLNLVALGAWILINFSVDDLWGGTKRVHGIVGNANGMAIMALGSLPIAGALAFDRLQTPRYRMVAVAAIFGGALTVMASGSRGCSIGAVVGALATAFVIARSMTTRVLSLIIASLLLIGAWQFAPTVLIDRVERSVKDSSELGSRRHEGYNERDDHIVMCLQMIPERPWFGHGYRGFPTRRSQAGMSESFPHNAILGVAVMSGVPAAAVYVALFLGAIWLAFFLARVVSRRDQYVMAGLFGVVCGLFVALQTLTADYSPRAMAWVAVCFIVYHRHDAAATAQVPAPPLRTAPIPIGG